MKKIRLLYLIFFNLVLTQCTESPQGFATYEFEPFRESIVKNKVTTSLAFESINGEFPRVDSISYDRQGNIRSRIYKGNWGTEDHFSYDSLNRVVYQTERSDTFTEKWTHYELFPSEQTVVKYIRFDTGEIRYKEFLKYDNGLNRILTIAAVDVYDGHSTTINITKFEYEGHKVKKVISERNGQIDGVSEYIYEDGQLLQIKRQHDGDCYQIDYVSKETGLIDSTTVRQQDVSMVRYYKYY